MDLIIIGEDTDNFSIKLIEVAQKKGLKATILQLKEAARLFTVSIGKQEATVTPDIPMIIRMPAPSPTRTSFDESFLYGECFANLWAAATICKSTVINRPTAKSFWGFASYSSVLTQLRAGTKVNNSETFSSQLPLPKAKVVNRQWYVQDIATLATEAFPDIPDGKGPYRARWSEVEPTYEIVLVLGDKTWRGSDVSLEHLQLEEKSVSLVKNLGMTFALTIWNISHELTEATLTRVNPFPSFEQVEFAWLELVPALFEELKIGK